MVHVDYAIERDSIEHREAFSFQGGLVEGLRCVVNKNILVTQPLGDLFERGAIRLVQAIARCVKNLQKLRI